MKIRLLLAACAMLWPAAAYAGPASDVVKFFYVPLRWEADPQFRDHFIDPARRLFELNDQTPDDEVGCIDFGPGIDAQDVDEATLKKTLRLKEEVDGDNARVTASFTLFPDDAGSHREMLWMLKKVDGTWKIADIASLTNGWKLSELNCMPDQ